MREAPKGLSRSLLVINEGERNAAIGAFVINLVYARAMKSFTKHLWFNTKKRRDYIHITDQINDLVCQSEIQEGFCLVSAMHITASVYVNDNESGLLEDIDEWLEGLAPVNPDYKHHQTGEDNGDAHLKRMILGHQVMLPITEGELDLGPWEAVFYAEFDGRRKKRVVVKIIGE